MRSDRRHELQQNELSAQLERVSDTVKQNATLLTSVVVGAIVIVVAGVWFVNQRASAQSEAWSRLRPSAETTDTAALLAQYQAVANENVTPAITRSAYLQIGSTAMSELRRNRPQTEAPNPERRAELREKAQKAFENVVANPGDDVTALGRALMGLGVLAEDAGKFDDARKFYEKVLAHDVLKTTPIGKEAAYRLNHMDEWATLIEFPEPVVPPMLAAPEADAAPGVFTPPADLTTIQSMPEAGADAHPSDEAPAAPSTTDAPEGDAAPDADADATAPPADDAGQADDETAPEGSPQ